MKFKKMINRCALVVGSVFVFAHGANASPVTGTVEGVFSNPVLIGSIVDPQSGVPIFIDNTTSAVFSGIGTNTFTWGTGDFPGINRSTISFAGNSFDNQPSDVNIEFGRFSFTNGTSGTLTLVFGVDLTLSVPSDPTVTPLTTRLAIATTSNTGTNAQNADFIAFLDTFPDTFNVFEGATASSILIGQFVGDPLISLLQLRLAPGDSDKGFIGNGLPAGDVPAPPTVLLLSIGALAARVLRKST